MSSTQTDLRSLRKNAPAVQPQATSTTGVPGMGASQVARPRSRWATRVLIPAGVLLVTGGILAYAGRDAFQPRLTVHATPVIPVSSAPADGGASGGDIDAPEPASALSPPAVLVQAPGWVEPAPFAIGVPALTGGVVSEVLVLEGDRVEAGQVVARLADEDARLALRAADAGLAQREADVHRAREAIATAEANVQVERLSADEVRDEVSSKRSLVASGGVGEGVFRRLEIRLRAMEARVGVAERGVQDARAALSQAETARDAAMVARDDASLSLSRTEVRTPVSGVVLSRLVEPGSRIGVADSGGEGALRPAGLILRVYEPAHLQVRVDVPIADAAKIGVGTRAEVSSDALAQETLTGTVTRIVHEANIQRNTVQFKVALDAPPPVLKPEMLTRVKFYADTIGSGQAGSSTKTGGDNEAAVLLVPLSAVTRASEGKAKVWVVEPGDRAPIARLREIEVVASPDEGYIAVINGLRLTDRVIVDPPEPPAIRDGTRLRVLDDNPASLNQP